MKGLNCTLWRRKPLIRWRQLNHRLCYLTATSQFALNVSLMVRWFVVDLRHCFTAAVMSDDTSGWLLVGVVPDIVTSDKGGGGTCFCPCLFVCLLARLLKNACMDLGEMLRDDRRRDMDELINFWARSGLWFGSSDAGTGLLSPISYKRWYAEFYVGKIPRMRCVVLKWLYSLSRRNTFVGGTCAPPSDLLVLLFYTRHTEQYLVLI